MAVSNVAVLANFLSASAPLPPRHVTINAGLALLLSFLPGSFLFSLSFQNFFFTWLVGWCKPFLGALESVASPALPSPVNRKPSAASEQRGAQLGVVLPPDWMNRERDTGIV